MISPVKLLSISVALALTISMTEAASAQAGLQNQAFSRWKVQDQCLAQSVKSFPDHDQKSLSNRDDYVDKCLSDHGLPPRARIVPKPAAPTTGTSP